MKVADWIIEHLAFAGIDTCFFVYGGAISEMVDAIGRQDKMKYVVAQHEQAAGFMAEGYAKVKGVPGFALATSGPGGGNLVTPIQNCFYDSVPCVFITGQVARNLIRPSLRLRQRGFQETPIADIVGPITKDAGGILHEEDIGVVLDALLHTAKEGRPGPVLLDVPIDVQRTEIDPAAIKRLEHAETVYDYKQVAHFMQDLSKCERPAILVGGGARSAINEIDAFSSIHSIPVFRTWNALDVSTDDMGTHAGTVGTYGGPGRNFGIANCDLLLVLGSRLSGRVLGGKPELFARGAKIYVVDVDQALLEIQERPVDVNICADAKEFVRLCYRHDMLLDFHPWLAQCRAWKEEYDPVLNYTWAGDEIHHYVFMRKLSEALPHNAVVVYDTGGNSIMMGHCFKSKEGQRIFSSNGNTPMGFALCGAIGAWFADPSRPVVCIIGDGGLQLNIQELQTIRHYEIPIKIMVLNNHILGNTKAYQRANRRPEIGCGPDGYSCPDFVEIAKAYGIEAYRLPNMKYIDDESTKELLDYKGPLLVDVPQHDFCDYRPRMTRWDTPIEEMWPYLTREEFKRNMLIAPWQGWKEIP